VAYFVFSAAMNQDFERARRHAAQVQALVRHEVAFI